MGHYFGLLHPFGSCDPDADGIVDTPRELDPASGCPTHRHSCPSHPGPDPVWSFMVSSSSACWPWRPLLAAHHGRWHSRRHRVNVVCPLVACSLAASPLAACLPTCGIASLRWPPRLQNRPGGEPPQAAQQSRLFTPTIADPPPPPLPPAPQDYSDDACMKRFSLGQVARMQAVVLHLRPGLVAASKPVLRSSKRTSSSTTTPAAAAKAAG